MSSMGLLVDSSQDQTEKGAMKTWSRVLIASLLALSAAGCATLRQFAPVVKLEPMTPGEYITLQRGDLLTTGNLSALTTQSIRVTGLDVDACAISTPDCIQGMKFAPGISDERRMSALSELWLQHATSIKGTRDNHDERIGAWLETARHAYAYLFFSGRNPGERAFEDRQVQVRDWYNYAVQEAVTLLFEESLRLRAAGNPEPAAGGRITRAGWNYRIDLSGIRLPAGVQAPKELLPASSLAFEGMRSTWRRDGFGAELVAVIEDDPVAAVALLPDESAHQRRRVPLWSEMPSPGITVLFRFPGENLGQVLATREVQVSVHDPYKQDSIVLRGQTLPLAANFTAGYGLWLARSGFNRQSLRSLFGRDKGIDRPHLYLMQPYDPQRRIILMLHGIASSPEAWVNVANEIQGDPVLRRNFQIWQVYYPTNAPVLLNHAAIRRVLSRTLQHFDPDGTAPASRDMVLVGHSMGGVIARLMVSQADQQLWHWVQSEYRLDAKQQDAMRSRMNVLLRFDPMPQFERVVFIATPHRGTVVAGKRLGRWLSRLVRLPLTLLQGFTELLQFAPAAQATQAPDDAPVRLPNSIDNLDEHDPFVRASADLPISPRVRYHSIIARSDGSVPLEQSDDGLVPYRSAHLAGAQSEKVIESGHSVQQTAPAILELRRILHLDLVERAGAQVEADEPAH